MKADVLALHRLESDGIHSYCMERVESMQPMPVCVSEPNASDEAIRKFSRGIATMGEADSDVQVGIADLVERLTLELRNQSTAKPHPILYVNLAFILSVAFACGGLWMRVAALEEKTRSVESISEIGRASCRERV